MTTTLPDLDWAALVDDIVERAYEHEAYTCRIYAGGRLVKWRPMRFRESQWQAAFTTTDPERITRTTVHHAGSGDVVADDGVDIAFHPGDTLTVIWRGKR